MSNVLPQKRIQNGMAPEDRLAEAEKILEDRSMGLTYQQLMDKYNYTRPTIKSRIEMALDARIAPTVDRYREQQNVALDNLARKWLEQLALAEEMAQRAVAINDDDITIKALNLRANALDGMIKVNAQRSKLNGLDAPVRSEVTITTPVDAEVNDLVEQMKRMNAQKEAELLKDETEQELLDG